MTFGESRDLIVLDRTDLTQGENTSKILRPSDTEGDHGEVVSAHNPDVCAFKVSGFCLPDRLFGERIECGNQLHRPRPDTDGFPFGKISESLAEFVKWTENIYRLRLRSRDENICIECGHSFRVSHLCDSAEYRVVEDHTLLYHAIQEFCNFFHKGCIALASRKYKASSRRSYFGNRSWIWKRHCHLAPLVGVFTL